MEARDQLTLDFTSRLNEALALIRSLERPLADLGPERAAGIIELLERIVLCSTDGVTSHARVSALAARIRDRRAVSERTVRRWRSDAVALDLLAVEDRSHKYGRSYTNVWQIAWPAIRALAAGGQADLGRTRGGHNVRPRADTKSAPYKSELKYEELPPPSPALPPEGPASATPEVVEDFVSAEEEPRAPFVRGSSAAVAPAQRPRCAWTPDERQAVADALCAAGIKLVQPLAIEFAGLGLTAATVVAVCADYTANSRLFHGPGAIAQRLRTGVWPTGKPVIPASEIAARRRRATAAQQQQEADQQAAADRDRALAEIYGPRLESLPAEELAALADTVFQHGPLRARYRQQGLASPLVRSTLISYLAERDQKG